MFNELIRFHSSHVIDLFLKYFISIVLLITFGPMVLSLENEIPITIQSFIILLIAVFWGWKIGVITTLIYILAGGFGLNVFAAYQSGWDRIFGEFGGFFFGFLAASLLTGYMAEQKNSRRPLQCLSVWLLGHLVILVLGGIWLRKMNPESWWPMIEIVLPGAAVKSAIGFLVTRLFVRMLVPLEERSIKF